MIGRQAVPRSVRVDAQEAARIGRLSRRELVEEMATICFGLVFGDLAGPLPAGVVPSERGRAWAMFVQVEALDARAYRRAEQRFQTRAPIEDSTHG